MQQHHVPAWKKLGLELKFAREKDGSNIDASEASTVSVSKKRSAEAIPTASANIVPTEAPIIKKRRVEEAKKSDLLVNGDRSRLLSPSLKKPISNGSKKKVSFTAETKQLDGDSSKLLLAAWDAENQPSAAYLAWQAEEEAAFEKERQESRQFNQKDSDWDLERVDKVREPEPKEKKKRQKQQKQPKIHTRPGKSRDALDYLAQYHQARQRWKFNKNREVWILKHIFSIEAIPESYDTALGEYVHGLGSESARSRLIESCEEVIRAESGQAGAGDRVSQDTNGKTSPEREAGSNQMEDPGSKRRYEKTLEASLDEAEANAFANSAEGSQPDSAYVRRAKLLLRSIPPVHSNGPKQKLPTQEPVSRSDGNGKEANLRSTPALNGKANGVVKKRKNRTAIIEVSEESSSSEDDSDEDGETEKNGGHHGASNSKAQSGPVLEDETSSNDSNSTSSYSTTSGSDDSASKSKATDTARPFIPASAARDDETSSEGDSSESE